ncbi:MAG: hypothetical protein ACTSU5_03620 [Promethearchaeota archaeon]
MELNETIEIKKKCYLFDDSVYENLRQVRFKEMESGDRHFHKTLKSILKKNPRGQRVTLLLSSDHLVVNPPYPPLGDRIEFQDITGISSEIFRRFKKFLYRLEIRVAGKNRNFYLSIHGDHGKPRGILYEKLLQTDFKTIFLENLLATLPSRLPNDRDHFPIEAAVKAFLDPKLWAEIPYSYKKQGLLHREQKLESKQKLEEFFREAIKEKIETQSSRGLFYYPEFDYLQIMNQTEYVKLLESIKTRLLGMLKLEGKIQLDRCAQSIGVWPSLLQRRIGDLLDKQLILPRSSGVSKLAPERPDVGIFSLDILA